MEESSRYIHQNANSIFYEGITQFWYYEGS